MSSVMSLVNGGSFFFQEENPKKPDTKSYERYESYKLTITYEEFLEEGGSLGDFKNDFKKGYITANEDESEEEEEEFVPNPFVIESEEKEEPTMIQSLLMGYGCSEEMVGLSEPEQETPVLSEEEELPLHINEDGSVLGEIQEDGEVIVLSEEEEEPATKEMGTQTDNEVDLVSSELSFAVRFIDLEKKYKELQQENKKLKEDLKWKDNDLYHVNKSNESWKVWGEHEVKLKKELITDRFPGLVPVQKKKKKKKQEKLMWSDENRCHARIWVEMNDTGVRNAIRAKNPKVKYFSMPNYRCSSQCSQGSDFCTVHTKKNDEGELWCGDCRDPPEDFIQEKSIKGAYVECLHAFVGYDSGKGCIQKAMAKTKEEFRDKSYGKFKWIPEEWRHQWEGVVSPHDPLQDFYSVCQDTKESSEDSDSE